MLNGAREVDHLTSERLPPKRLDIGRLTRWKPDGDEDRWLEVVTESVDEGTDDAVLIFVVVRSWFAAPYPRRRTASSSTRG